MYRLHKLLIGAAVVGTVTLSGCATQEDYDVSLVTEVKAHIDQAQELGAEDYAPLPLYSAKENLSAAQGYINDGEDEKAQRSLEKAEADAEYALAKTSSEKAQVAAEQLEKDLESLKREL